MGSASMTGTHIRGRSFTQAHRENIATALRKHFKRNPRSKRVRKSRAKIKRERSLPPGWLDFLLAVRPQDRRRRGWAYQIWYYYGLTAEDYAILWNRQNGCCAICEKPMRDGTGGAGVDHNHKTGKVRGILCTHCNYRVLHVVERARLLIPKALAYLEAHESEAYTA